MTRAALKARLHRLLLEAAKADSKVALADTPFRLSMAMAAVDAFVESETAPD